MGMTMQRELYLASLRARLDAVRALVAMWRDGAVCEGYDDYHRYTANAMVECADELEAAIGGSDDGDTCPICGAADPVICDHPEEPETT